NNLIYECAFVWNVQTMDTTTQAYQLHRALFSLKQSPNRSMIGVVMSANPNLDSIFIINTSTFIPRYIGEPDHGSCNTPSVDWSHDSRYFITSSGNCNTPASIVVWDVQQGTAAYRYKADYAGGSIAIYASKDDKYILGVGEGGIGLFNFLKGTDVPLEPKVSSTLYPNPTNGNITIPFNQSIAEPTIITVQDSKGAIVKELFNQYLDAGQQNLTFNVADLSQGIYFVRVQSRHNEIIFKMIVEK
ncbi:MAG TPA: T9SS type A sorting domain-containing protein, partial [Candidatus Kapabacteria bacterium]|nr:T9SS type A sorting domain-containing protein [Candidatus Kapabacteria bacterium]